MSILLYYHYKRNHIVLHHVYQLVDVTSKVMIFFFNCICYKCSILYELIFMHNHWFQRCAIFKNGITKSINMFQIHTKFKLFQMAFVKFITNKFQRGTTTKTVFHYFFFLDRRTVSKFTQLLKHNSFNV